MVSKEENFNNWLDAELNETLDEMFESELNQPLLSAEMREHIKKIYKGDKPKSLDKKIYFKNLLKLQAELIKLQDWIVHTNAKVLIICEGRDSAGKGGVIKRITQRLDPRVARVVALPKPSEREQSQWYFQRFVPHLPAGGEMVLFDRSWYNRAGVEKVMKFATRDQVEQFYRDVPEFEKMLVRSGIVLLKYWFSITDEEQQLRFLIRLSDPLKAFGYVGLDASRQNFRFAVVFLHNVFEDFRHSRHLAGSSLPKLCSRHLIPGLVLADPALVPLDYRCRVFLEILHSCRS